jgi:hypothetical protein
MFKRALLSAVTVLTVATGFASAQPWWGYNPDIYYERQARRWVQLYLNRNPTIQEQAMVVEQLRRGVSPIAVQANILSSDEYMRRWGGNTQGFIQGLYRDILGRNATVAEVGAAVGQVNGLGRYRYAGIFLTRNTRNQFFVPVVVGPWGTGLPWYDGNFPVLQPILIPRPNFVFVW